MNAAKSDGYHHGDLPATLMDLALRQIAEEGTENLSLRSLARAAGVSATAPYRHFPSKRCLLAALATRGFRMLSAENARNIHGPDDLESRFLRLGMGYVNFALANPTSYHIMFGSVLDDFSAYPDLTRAAEEAYAPVLELTAEAIASNPGWEMTASRLGGMTWSVVHGIASLLIYKVQRPEQRQKPTPLASLDELKNDPELALRTLMQGILYPRLAGPSDA